MRVPKLRQHRSGHYFVHYAGKDHYLGLDKREAEAKYHEHLRDWSDWWKEKRAVREKGRGRGRVLVGEVAKAFLESKQKELTKDGVYHYEKSLAHFLDIYSKQDVNWIRPKHLNSAKSDMLYKGRAPRTINHMLNSVRTLMRWAGAMDYVSIPIDFSVIPNVALGPVAHNHASPEVIRSAIAKAPGQLQAIMAVQYLSLCRPSEILRLVNEEGNFSETGVFVASRGKMDRRVAMPRTILLSDEALAWLKCTTPRHYVLLSSYSAAMRGKKHGKYRESEEGPFPPGPKVLQKSAAQHLVMKGVPVADIELLLGHYIKRMDFTYFTRHWQRLREQASLLTLGIPAPTASPSPAGGGRSRI